MSASELLPPSFAVGVEFSAPCTEVAVRGELDCHTAPELDAIVQAVIEHGHRTVVLDLSELDFMDAAGLEIIARAADRLDAVGGELTLRAPSPMVLRILAITGLTERVRLEPPQAAPEHLGPEQTVNDPGTAVERSPIPLTAQLRTVSSMPADDDVVDGALRLVVALARATVGGADGVSVSLQRHGRLSTVAASDQTISDMDVDQYHTGEGPCVDASVEGRWFHVESLATETRWPDFIPKARTLGINAILSSPLLAGDRPVGALNIYSRTKAAFAPKDQALAAVFATQASKILTEAGVDVSDDELAARIHAGLRSRQMIAQAQGVLMARDGVDAMAAFTTLRRSSCESGRPLLEHARAVLASLGPPSPHPETVTRDG